MSRQVDLTAPLSEDDRNYLHSRGLHTTVERVDAEHGTEVPSEGDGEEEPLNYNEWTVQELQDEIRDRNMNRPVDNQLSVAGKKPDLVARLEADDRGSTGA